MLPLLSHLTSLLFSAGGERSQEQEGGNETGSRVLSIKGAKSRIPYALKRGEENGKVGYSRVEKKRVELGRVE